MRAWVSGHASGFLQFDFIYCLLRSMCHWTWMARNKVIIPPPLKSSRPSLRRPKWLYQRPKMQQSSHIVVTGINKLSFILKKQQVPPTHWHELLVSECLCLPKACLWGPHQGLLISKSFFFIDHHGHSTSLQESNLFRFCQSSPSSQVVVAGVVARLRFYGNWVTAMRRTVVVLHILPLHLAWLKNAGDWRRTHSFIIQFFTAQGDASGVQLSKTRSR